MGILGDILSGFIKGATSDSPNEKQYKKEKEWALKDYEEGNPESYEFLEGQLEDNMDHDIDEYMDDYDKTDDENEN